MNFDVEVDQFFKDVVSRFPDLNVVVVAEEPGEYREATLTLPGGEGVRAKFSRDIWAIFPLSLLSFPKGTQTKTEPLLPAGMVAPDRDHIFQLVRDGAMKEVEKYLTAPPETLQGVPLIVL